MNQDEIKVLFALMRSAIDGNELNPEVKNIYSPEMLPKLLKISSKHDIVHLLALGLKQNNLIPTENSSIEDYTLKAVYRYERLRYEHENLCDALEKAKIPFLTLKGSVMRKYYPEPWMRTSCDIDILVHEVDMEKAKSVLLNEYGYTYHQKGSHDVSFFTTSGVHVELHYNLVEDGRVNESSEVLKTVWDKATVREGFNGWFLMPDEMFYFYHVAHMAKHFEDGGCGIRPFIDLWILNNIQDSNEEKRNQLLNEGGLLKFAQAARRLSSVWFEGCEYDDVSRQMERFILQGGIYGSSQNRIIVHQQKMGGRFRYAFSKIVIPYDIIKFQYPILQKYRWLTPFMHIRRWCKLIFCGHKKRVIDELKYNQNVSKKESLEARKFLSDIGL